MGLGNLPTMMPMERTGQRRRKKLRRMRCRHQKIRKGTSGYALRAFPANLKSGQFICSKSGQFYLLTTGLFYFREIFFAIAKLAMSFNIFNRSQADVCSVKERFKILPVSPKVKVYFWDAVDKLRSPFQG